MAVQAQRLDNMSDERFVSKIVTMVPAYYAADLNCERCGKPWCAHVHEDDEYSISKKLRKKLLTDLLVATLRGDMT